MIKRRDTPHLAYLFRYEEQDLHLQCKGTSGKESEANVDADVTVLEIEQKCYSKIVEENCRIRKLTLHIT